MEKLVGVSVSSGIVIAKIHSFHEQHINTLTYYVNKDTVEHEYRKFLQSVELAKQEVDTLRDELEHVSTPADYKVNNDTIDSNEDQESEVDNDISSDIVNVYMMLLDDNEFHQKVKDLIYKSQVNAEWAVTKVIQSYIDTLHISSNHDDYLAERAHDFNDIGMKIIQSMNQDIKRTITLSEPSILLANNLFPTQFLRMNKDHLLGIALEEGGLTSHVAIIAKARGIPMIIGVKDVFQHIDEGTTCILDATHGELLYKVEESDVQRYKDAREEETKVQLQLESDALHTQHRDKEGNELSIELNIDMMEELNDKNMNVADGIGLFRSEFILEEILPYHDSEMKQFNIYKTMVLKAGGKPVTVRTFDAGGDKLPVTVTQLNEDNPLLGYRGIRFCLEDKGFFLCQLKALLRASSYGNLRILIPMVSCVEEMVEVHECVVRAKKHLDTRGHAYKDVPIGVMIEVPSMVHILADIAEYCDFFSIGTNDLLQYTMATDRGNKSIAKLYNYYHPAFLRCLNDIFRKVKLLEKPITVCGEMASYGPTIPLLLGMGLTSFSVSSPQLASTIVRTSTFFQMDTKNLVEEVLSCSTVKEVHARVEGFFDVHSSNSR